MQPDYAWVITRDHLYEDSVKDGDLSMDDESGTAGPHGATDAQIAQVLKSGFVFMIYDDDDILYYTGKFLDFTLKEDNVMHSDWLMAPLDDYGEPNAGAVTIKYKSDRGRKGQFIAI